MHPKNIAQIKALLSPDKQLIDEEKSKESISTLILRVIGVDIGLCKHCKKGRLVLARIIMPVNKQSNDYIDTS